MTAQSMERLFYKNENMLMATNPLNHYLQKRNDIKFTWRTSNCKRGYNGQWEIRDNKLYLISLTGYIERYKQVNLSYLFPSEQIVFANWFSGEIKIPQGKILDYVHIGYGSLYEWDLILEIKNGELINEHIIYNHEEYQKRFNENGKFNEGGIINKEDNARRNEKMVYIFEGTFAIKSKYIFSDKILDWAFIILLVTNFFLKEFIPQESKPSFEIFLTFIYVLLFIGATFNFLFESFSKSDIELTLEKLEQNKGINLIYNTKEKDVIYSKFTKAKKELFERYLYVHFLKTKKELTNISNSRNLIMVLAFLFMGQFSFDYLKPFGATIFIILILVSIVYCLRITIWEGLENKKINSPVVIGHLILIYFLFAWGKNSFVRNYGDEIIGSYFEKPRYSAKYFVNIYSEDGEVEINRLPAEIHVYSEIDFYEDGEDIFTLTSTNRTIIIDKVYLPNKGSYIDLQNCEVKIGIKTRCNDHEDRIWFIQLTNEQVPIVNKF